MENRIIPNDNHTTGINERAFWTEFLILYRNQPALWDATIEQYKHKNAKIKGYTLLTEKLTELIPDATRNDVLRRINIFRTNYRRERVRSLMHRERGQNYQTSLWYFNLLSFLEPQMKIRTRKRPDVLQQQEDQSVQKLCDQLQYENDGRIEYIVYENEKKDVPKKCSVPKKRQKLEEMYECNDVGEDTMADEQEAFEYYVEDNNKMHNTQQNDLRDGNIAITCENEESEYADVNHDDQYKLAKSNNEESITRRPTSNEYVDTDDDIEINTHTENIETTPSEYIIDQSSEPKSSPKIIQPRNFARFQQAQRHNTDTPLSTAGEILARSWALQYDEMSSQQKIFARKAIADILFAGCMGTLGTNRS